jgi:hypothetical protein
MMSFHAVDGSILLEDEFPRLVNFPGVHPLLVFQSKLSH